MAIAVAQSPSDMLRRHTSLVGLTAVRNFDAEASSVEALQGSPGAVENSDALSPPALPVGKPSPPPPLEPAFAQRSSIPDALLPLICFLGSSMDDWDGRDACTSVQWRSEASPLPENPTLCVAAQFEAVRGVLSLLHLF